MSRGTRSIFKQSIKCLQVIVISSSNWIHGAKRKWHKYTLLLFSFCTFLIFLLLSLSLSLTHTHTHTHTLSQSLTLRVKESVRVRESVCVWERVCVCLWECVCLRESVCVCDTRTDIVVLYSLKLLFSSIFSSLFSNQEIDIKQDLLLF